jgi:hypothetical protein
MHITRFLPTLLTWSRVDIVSSCRESTETNWEDDFLLLSDVSPQLRITQPNLLIAKSRFFMVGATPVIPSHAAHFLLSTSQSMRKPILRGEI